MTRERLALLLSISLSILLHFGALFRLYIVARFDTPNDGDGRVSLVRAVLMETPPAGTAGTGAAGWTAPEEASTPMDEAQLKLQKTEAALPAPVRLPEPIPETISTVPEIAAKVPAAEPAGAAAPEKPAEVSGTPAESGAASGGKAAGETLITHVPAGPEAPPGPAEPSAGEPAGEGAKTAKSPPTDKPQVEEGRESGKRTGVPQDLPETTPFIPVYRVDKKPELVRKATLSYPSKARELNIQGTVILEVNIDEKGTVSGIRVVKGVGFGLDEEAVRWMRASAFTPAYVQDKPVAVKMQYPVTFKLNK